MQKKKSQGILEYSVNTKTDWHFLKNLTRLTVKLKPSGGASNHESSDSKKSMSETPGFLGHFTVTESFCSISASSIVPSSTTSSGRGNIIIPASETAQDPLIDEKPFVNQLIFK